MLLLKLLLNITIIKYHYIKSLLLYLNCLSLVDRLCGLVVRVPGYRFRSPGFDCRHYKKKSGTGPLSLVSTTEELLESNSSGSGLESLEYGCRDSSR
jgi:hypothetical protein